MVIILFFFKQKGGNPVKKFVVILLVVVASTLSLYAERINTATQGEVEGMFFEGGNFDYSSFQFALGGFDLEKSEVKDGTFLLVKGLQGDSTSKYGYPQLPVQRVWIEIPYGVEPSIEVSGETYFDYDLKAMGYDFPIYPQQPSVVKLPDATQPFVMDKKVYSDDCFYPEENLKIEGETFVRAHRILNVLIQPFQYNPAKNLLRVYTSFSLKVKTENSLYDATVAEHQRTYSQSYEDYLSKKILNYGIYNISDPKTSYKDGILVITYDSFNTTDLQNYVELKRKWGYKVQVATLTQTGSTATAIKSYIQNAYNTWSNPSLGFVIFIGAYEYIPATNMTTGDSATKTDLYYQTVSGGDILPDISLARMTISSTSQLSTVLTRLTNYQLGNFTSTAWIDNISYLGTCDSSYYTVAEGTHNYCVTNYTSPAGYTGNFPNNPQAGGDKLYCVTYSASDQNCIDRFNQGRSIVTHSGHCSPTQFAGPYIYVSNVQSLTNGEKTPFVIGHCCQSNQWEGTALTIGEAWLQSASIGYWGSVDYTYWTEDDLLQKDWYNEVFTNGYYRVGQFTDLAKIDFYNNPGGSSRVTYYLEEYNLNGDPTLEIWTNQPSTMTVTHDSAIIIGSSSYQVTVTDGANPISQALVCLYKPDEGVHEVALTNSSGVATVGLSPAITNTGNVNLMVTKHDYKPYQATLTAISPSGPYLSYQSYAVVQEISGNGDGIVNPGETIQMSITLKNVGSDEGTGISGTLSTTSSDVSITDNYAQYPDITANGTGSSITNHYTFVVGSGVANGYSIPFTLNWSATGDYSGSVNFAVPVCVPLTISGVSVTNITGTSATINWSTNVPSTSLVNYGTSIPPSSQMSSDSLVTTHTINLTGLTQCTSYRFSVSSTSAGCYTILDTNGGSYYTFETGINVNPTYNSTDVPKTISDNSTITSSIIVTDNKIIQDVNVTIGSITHTYDGDLSIYLIAPDNTRVELSTGNGSSGDNYTNTIFDDEATTSITSGSAPFTGSFKPEGTLSTLDGKNAQGVWKLEVTDGASGDTGTLNSWSITFTYPAQSCGASLEYQSNTFTDSCSGTGSGNNDGYIDPGEDITIQITLHNNGTYGATGVVGTLSSTTAGVSVTDNYATYPDILADGSGVSQANHYTVHIDNSVACGTTLNFLLHITSNEGSWDRTFSLTVGQIVPGGGTILNENFASGIPGTWSVIDGGSGGGAASTWTTANPGGRTATSPIATPFAIVDSDNAGSSATQDEQLITPVLDLSTATSVTLQFDQYFRYYSYGGDEYGDVDVKSSKTGGAWTNVFRNHGADSANPDHRTIDITAQAAGASNVQVRFHYYQGSYDWYWMVDNVKVTYTAPGGCNIHPCTPSATPPPEIATGTNYTWPTATQSSQIMGWNTEATATGYRVYRGTLANLGNLCNTGTDFCTRYDGTNTTLDITSDNPATIDSTNKVIYYLIVAYNAGGEGPSGTATCGTRVVNTTGTCTP
jgi:subtilisin-like proprotein convertase family protein